jgi:hypothetical protein
MDKTQQDFDLFGEAPDTKQTASKKVSKKKTEKKTSSKKSKSKAVAKPVKAKVAEPVEEQKTEKALTPFRMRQAIVGWLLTQSPCGIGVKVPTRNRKYQVEAAAFWSTISGSRQSADRTVIVEVRHDREQCWPDCGDKENLLATLRELKQEKIRLEAVIRETEPSLKDTDNLFEEYQYWNYHRSRNQDYQNCLLQIDKVAHSIYKGSRLELIRQAKVADFLYLAVPEGEIQPSEVADGWGLLFIDANQKVRCAKVAQRQICSQDSRLHLIQNIARCCLSCMMFMNGIKARKDGRAEFTRAPRRRRK